MSDEVMLMFRFYNDALNAACGTPGEWRASVLEVGNRTTFTIDLVDPHLPQGLFVMLVSASVCALFFTILVWCNSHTWIYFKHKGKYVKVEDQVRKTSIYEIGVSDNVFAFRTRICHSQQSTVEDEVVPWALLSIKGPLACYQSSPHYPENNNNVTNWIFLGFS